MSRLEKFDSIALGEARAQRDARPRAAGRSVLVWLSGPKLVQGRKPVGSCRMLGLGAILSTPFGFSCPEPARVTGNAGAGRAPCSAPFAPSMSAWSGGPAAHPKRREWEASLFVAPACMSKLDPPSGRYPRASLRARRTQAQPSARGNAARVFGPNPAWSSEQEA